MSGENFGVVDEHRAFGEGHGRREQPAATRPPTAACSRLRSVSDENFGVVDEHRALGEGRERRGQPAVDEHRAFGEGRERRE